MTTQTIKTNQQDLFILFTFAFAYLLSFQLIFDRSQMCGWELSIIAYLRSCDARRAMLVPLGQHKSHIVIILTGCNGWAASGDRNSSRYFVIAMTYYISLVPSEEPFENWLNGQAIITKYWSTITLYIRRLRTHAERETEAMGAFVGNVGRQQQQKIVKQLKKKKRPIGWIMIFDEGGKNQACKWETHSPIWFCLIGRLGRCLWTKKLHFFVHLVVMNRCE